MDLISSTKLVCNVYVILANGNCIKSFIYVKCNTIKIRELWDNLMIHGGNPNLPWFIGGDFNMVI